MQSAKFSRFLFPSSCQYQIHANTHPWARFWLTQCRHNFLHCTLPDTLGISGQVKRPLFFRRYQGNSKEFVNVAVPVYLQNHLNIALPKIGSWNFRQFILWQYLTSNEKFLCLMMCDSVPSLSLVSSNHTVSISDPVSLFVRLSVFSSKTASYSTCSVDDGNGRHS